MAKVANSKKSLTYKKNGNGNQLLQCSFAKPAKPANTS